MIRNGGRPEETRELKPTVAVRRAHHSDLNGLIAQAGDTSCPFSFDRGSPFELKAEFQKEVNCSSEVLDDDSNVVHPFQRHVSNLQDAVQIEQRTLFATPKHEQRGYLESSRMGISRGGYGHIPDNRYAVKYVGKDQPLRKLPY